MFVRYQNARTVFIVLGAVALGGMCCAGGFAWSVFGAQTEPPPPSYSGGPPSKTPKVVASSGPTSDADVIRVADAPAKPNSKAKDALGPGGWKVNLYEETGDTHYDRLKIDKDRDETDDEKWNYKQGRWEKDDGKRVWVGGRWADADDEKKAAADASAPNPSGSAEFSDIVQKLLKDKSTGEKLKDVYDGAGPKFNLYDDDKNGSWDRAKLDRDRDDTWDEAWTVKDGVVERKNETSGQIQIFKDGAWIPK